jgi:replicative DNA helicase
MNALAPQLEVANDIETTPSNLEAEQAVLGAIMYDNAAFERVPDRLRAEHFYEPFHARVFTAMGTLIAKGQLAEPIVLTERFKSDPGFADMGGLRYFALLIDKAPTPSMVRDLANLVHDLAVRRELLNIYSDGAAAARKDGETPALEQLEAVEGQLYALAETGAQSSGVSTFATALSGALEAIGAAFSSDGGVSGVSTGLIDLDKKLGGLHPSDLSILAGRPSMGKTALATNVAFSVARAYAYEQQPDGTRKTTAGGQVLFFSLEMSEEQLAMRILAEASGVSGDRMRKGEISPAEYARIRDASIEISQAPLFIDDTGGLSMAKLAARARRQKRLTGLDLIVVDYLQLVTTTRKNGDNRVQEVSEVTQGLKALAKDLGVPVLALSQLSRQVESREDKRPQLSDLRESGSIEQDADVVMFVYREAYYLGRAEPKEGTPEHLTWQDEMGAIANVADVIIGKQRHGPIGTVKLSFNEDLTKFGNLARDMKWDIR